MIFVYVILILIFFIFAFSVFRGSPYIPSHRADVRRALEELYLIGKKDTLVDIGSGDGIILREAAKKGASAVGYEINPLLVIVSRFLLRKNNKVKVVFTDFWFSHLPEKTTVIYVFSVSRDIKKIIEWVQNETNRLNRPMNLISYGSRLDGVKLVKNIGAHHLYVFYPLQINKAQV
jgi:hypothetical protein